MKKIFTTLLALTLVFSFAFAGGSGKSCGSKEKSCCATSKTTETKTVKKADCSPLDGKCGSKKANKVKSSEKLIKPEKKKTTETAPI